MPERCQSQTSYDEPQQPTAPASRSDRSKRKTENEKPSLRLTSMVDVIFLLLIFFVITASFVQDEGAILASMPGNISGEPQPLPPAPLLIELASSDDGLTYSIRVRGRPVDSVSQLYQYFDERTETGRLAHDDPVQIKPDGVVRWQHVLNVYNACIRADLHDVGFAPM